MFDWTTYSKLTCLQINVDTIFFLTVNLIRSLIQPTLWLVWHTKMHNSLAHRSQSPSNPQEKFLPKILRWRDLFASRKFTLLTQRNTTTLIHRKRKNSDTLKVWFNILHFYLVQRSLQRTFEQFSYFLP